MNKTRLLRIVAAIFIALVAVTILRYILGFTPKGEIIKLDTGWNVSINSNTYENVDITKIYQIFDGKL